MLPDGEGVTNHATHDAEPVDTYLVSLVKATREDRAAKHAENIRVVQDEMLGTSTRRRAQLLNTGR